MSEIYMKSSPMRLIGYWMESLNDCDYLPPQEFVWPFADDIRTTVADYLDRGDIFATYRGPSWCRFYCAQDMGCREMADGCWVWPEQLGHYVRDHGVALPVEFVEHVRAGTPPIPRSLWSDEPVDKTFWKNWCQQHSLGRYQSRIAEARLRADVEVAKQFNARVAAMEAKEGVSNQHCQWRGCERFALKNRALCAACCLGAQSGLDSPFYDLRNVLTEQTE